MQTFDKKKRLLTSADYAFVFDKADFKVSHRHYLILARRNALGSARLGLVIAKKNTRLSTRRNRIKRVARETFRTYHQHLDSLDLVFLTRKGFDTLQPTYQTQLLTEAWCEMARRAGRER